jgi:hypothetical protein
VTDLEVRRQAESLFYTARSKKIKIISDLLAFGFGMCYIEGMIIGTNSWGKDETGRVRCSLTNDGDFLIKINEK